MSKSLSRISHLFIGILTVAFAAALGMPSAYANISASMKLKDNVVQLGESTSLYVTIVADGGEALSSPQIPEYEWTVVELVGQNHKQSVNFVNGKITSVKTLTLTYRVTPLEAGQYAFTNMQLPKTSTSIEPVSITIMDSNSSSSSSSSSQNQSSSNPSSRSIPNQSQQNEHGLSMLAELEKNEYYLGEEIILTYYLYYPMNVRDISIQKIEDSRNQFQGFWKEQVEIKQQIERLSGSSLVRAPIMSYVLYPLTPGKHTIDSIRLHCNISDRRTIFPRRFIRTTVQSKPVDIQVNPLPTENKPDIFEGAVGQFQLTSTVEDTDIEEGSHVSLKVTLAGQGNIKNAPDPILPDLSKFDQYDPTREENIQVRKDGMRGQITYSHPLLPHDITANRIGPVRYAYFDPEQEAYQVLKTNPISLNIIPGSNQARGGGFANNRRIITRIGDDFRYIDTSTLAISNVFMPVYFDLRYWLMAVLALLVLVLAVTLKWRREYLQHNPKVAKSLTAPKQAKRLLNEARQSMQSGNTESIYSQLGKAVTDYISNRWNLACAGMTSGDLRQALPQNGVSESCTEEVIQLLEEFDAARFSGAANDPEQVKHDYQKTERVLSALMNQKSHA